MNEDLQLKYVALWAAKAADTIREFGWVQGEMYSDEGCCLLGALESVKHSVYDRIVECGPRGFDPYTVRLGVMQRIAAMLPDVEIPVMWVEEHLAQWNDDMDRTEQEVLEVLDKVARQ